MRANRFSSLRLRYWPVFVMTALLCVFSFPTLAYAQESGRVNAGTLDWSVETTWAYETVDGKYANIFKEQGRMYAAVLFASHKNGKYVDDEIGVYNVDPSSPTSRGWKFPIQEGEYNNNIHGVEVKAKVKKRDGSLWLSVIIPNAGRGYEIPVKSLFMSRAKKAKAVTYCGRSFLEGAQSGSYIYFDPSVTNYFTQAPPENFRLLAPTYIGVWIDRSRQQVPKFEIGNTGCWMHYRGGWYSPNT